VFRTGLYDEVNEHDGCGVAMVARVDNVATHETVARGLQSLCNLEHRGAEGADVGTGDGAGILLQMPDRFLRASVHFELPERGRYGVAMCFLPTDAAERGRVEGEFIRRIESRGLVALGWRDVPVRPETIGRVAREAAPRIRQLFIAALDAKLEGDRLERELYVARRLTEIAVGKSFYVCSCSTRTLVYKGMLAAPQLHEYFPDLLDTRVESAIALVHSRFSTNTFPTWRLAHPFRMMAHNGEVNTVVGNGNWMRARESQLESELFGAALEDMLPVIEPGGSDSACLDNVLELLVQAGRSLPHAVMMLVPKAWQGNDDMPRELGGFYRYHSCLMEPWDGPACVTFTDGRIIGATLDRNGLRPGRWAITLDGWVVMASEAGTLPVDESKVVRKGRLQPGRLFVVDLERHHVFYDGQVELEVARQNPYGTWYSDNVVRIADLPRATAVSGHPVPYRLRQLAFGWSQEDMRLIAPLVQKGKEANGSMGADIPLAAMSAHPVTLFNYFKQRFAQVTNPPIDPVREAVVMSLEVGLGPERNLLEETPEHCARLILNQPILTEGELSRIRQGESVGLEVATLDATFRIQAGPEGLEHALITLCAAADAAIEQGAAILIVSDRAISAMRAPIPALMAVGAVHHHLVRQKTRLRVGIIVETGEAREVHHMACLVGFGAAAIHPYMLFESIAALVRSGDLPQATDVEAKEKAIVAGIGQGLLKILSKMGISTLHSYMGAQVFEALGLDDAVIQRCFVGTPSRIGGVGFEVLGQEALERHRRGFPAAVDKLLPTGGVYAWRRNGEVHMWNPETVPLLQRAVRGGSDAHRTYAEFARSVNEGSGRHATLRGLLRFRPCEPVPLDEVEPAQEIVKRFATGAMSLGSISPESHATLAVAMNRIGGKSNTGEGGEDPARFEDERRSAIKQVASARFGVTIHYLVNADQLQIKVAQGAKPGEGGQLPGHKVSEQIAALRYSTPGVELISPPPHHDIYSIEDLKQLIYDLRCANPRASVSVKLVAEVGVGTVAAGVAKANADHIVIAGHDGGTGSSPLSSIHHAGIPWELGLAETQQTLVLHDLRSRVRLQVDGHLKTGRDVVVAGLLGAEEMGFSTAPLIALGCIMMRVCHLNTCPVGIATQDPELRRRFTGTPEHVMNYLFLVAEEAREIMARLGVRRFEDLIGRTDLLEPDPETPNEKAKLLDLSRLLAPANAPSANARRQTRLPDPVLDDALDHELIRAAAPALERREPVLIEHQIRNKNRTVGGMLSSEIARRHGRAGLPEGTVRIRLHGSAGQSFAAWLAPGVELSLSGEANDYVGKGLSGGVISVRPSPDAKYAAEDNVIVGNTVLYGATSGRAFFRGKAGERFAVRNSGARAVVEGVGDHGCEYMTGGVVVVLGRTGINFAAGMSGGVAYVYDPGGHFARRCNYELVELERFERSDWAELRALIAEHIERTDSAVGRQIFDDWAVSSRAFVKVMPRAFKKALKQTQHEESIETAAPEEVTV
jgi:glutamate synthase domain-containing protein 2/glutamate synthase domain-containing protein 1/glutamate synthase domain-containing protein 3